VTPISIQIFLKYIFYGPMVIPVATTGILKQKSIFI